MEVDECRASSALSQELSAFWSSTSMPRICAWIANSGGNTNRLDLKDVVSIELECFRRESAALGRGIELPRDLHFKALSMAHKHLCDAQ